jgi:xanthine dehydrogenase accessory factor
MNASLLEHAAAAIRSGQSVCLVTVVETSGSTPRKAGAKMLVFADGRTEGTIGGGLVERAMVAQAAEVLATGAPRLVTHMLQGESAESSEMICGGEMRIYLEPYGRGRHLYIFGGGHCGLALAPVAARVGFAVHVLDDRPEVVTRERFPMAASLTHGTYADIAGRIKLRPDAYLVIMTESHRGDAAVLANVITHEYVYLGMMASTRKRAQTFTALQAQGIAADMLARVHSPIGLPIDSETPEEIAVSITAELVQVARAHENACASSA